MKKKTKAITKRIENSAPIYVPKHAQDLDDFDYDGQFVVSSSEMTGLTAIIPTDDEEAAALNDIYDINLRPSDSIDDDLATYTPKHRRD